MQRDQQHLPDQVGNGYVPNPPVSSFFGQNVDFQFQFQPSKICPRNFVIFDRSYNHSQIMYHPETSPPGFGYFQDNNHVRNDENAPREDCSFTKEDSADIDLLLSFEEDGDYEEEEEEVSTARTHGNDENALTSDTADSRSFRRGDNGLGLSSSSSFSRKSNGVERKRRKMRKLVNSLRGIVPGGNGMNMNTVGVLDEAVKYLTSLKVELQKVGVASLKN